MISDERLEEVINGDILFTDEQREMARELVAYRKAFSEPCGFINPVYFSDGMMGCTLHKKIRRNGLVPLYRKPATQDQEI